MNVAELTGSARLRAERANRGLNHRDAAAAIGELVTADILMRAENGARPRPQAAKAIADFYDCLVTDIWPIEQVAA